jgi:hypothetical protein
VLGLFIVSVAVNVPKALTVAVVVREVGLPKVIPVPVHNTDPPAGTVEPAEASKLNTCEAVDLHTL